MASSGFRPIPLGGSQEQQQHSNQNHSQHQSQMFHSQTDVGVPSEIRKKIQLMLLLKHSALGCLVSCLQDEYKVCFGDDIFPEMFGYHSWLEMCRAMPEELTIETVKRHPVVNGKPLTHSLTIEYLGRIFTSPSESVTSVATTSTMPHNFKLEYTSNINELQSASASSHSQNGSQINIQIHSSQSHMQSGVKTRSRNCDTDAVDRSHSGSANSGFNSDSAITGNDVSQVQDDAVSSHQVTKQMERTRRNSHQQSSTSTAASTPASHSHSQFQFAPALRRAVLSEQDPISNDIPLIDLSDEMDDDSDFSTPSPVETKPVVSMSSSHRISSHSLLTGRSASEKSVNNSHDSDRGRNGDVHTNDISPNSKKRRILSSSTSVLSSAASTSTSKSTIKTTTAKLPVQGYNKSSPSVPSSPVPVPHCVQSSNANTNTNAKTVVQTDSTSDDVSMQVDTDGGNNDNDNDNGCDSDIADIKPAVSSLPQLLSQEKSAQEMQHVDVKPDMTDISVSNENLPSSSQSEDTPMEQMQFGSTLSPNSPSSPQSGLSPSGDPESAFHMTDAGGEEVVGQGQDDIYNSPVYDLEVPRNNGNTAPSSSISPVVKRIVSLSMDTVLGGFQAISNPFASTFFGGIKPANSSSSVSDNSSPNSCLSSSPNSKSRGKGKSASSTVTSAIASSTSTSPLGKGQHPYSLPTTPAANLNNYNDSEETDPNHHQQEKQAAVDLSATSFNLRSGVTTRSSRGVGLQRSRSQEMSSIYESFLSAHSASRRGGTGRTRGKSSGSPAGGCGASSSSSDSIILPEKSLFPPRFQVAMKHYPPLHLRGRGGGGGSSMTSRATTRRSDFNPDDMDESESVIKLLAENTDHIAPGKATYEVASVSDGGEPIPGTSRAIPPPVGQDTIAKAKSFLNSTIGRKFAKDDTGIRLNTIKWFTPYDSGQQGNGNCHSSSGGSGRNPLTFKYTTGRTTRTEKQSLDRFLDQYACEIYAPNTDLLLLKKMRKSRNPKVMCFHPFWSLMQNNRTNNSFQHILSTDTEVIPALSFESVQLANLDADMGFELSNHGLLHDQLQFISSYGNFADYFCWINPKKVKGMGLMPTDDNLKFVHCPAISYENFQLFSDGEVDIFDPTTKRNFEEFISLSSSFAPHSHVQSQSNALSVYVDIFVADGMGYPGMKNRPQDLCLLQFLLALETVREGGIFVLKVDDTLTCFNVCLIYLMSRCFYQISIHKPESALPGERFIVCRWKRADEHICEIKEYLSECNMFRIEDSWSETNLEIVRLFGEKPTALTLGSYDPPFLNYVQAQNEAIAKQEVTEYELMEEKYSTNRGNPNRILLAQTTIKRNNYLLSWNLSRSTSLLEQQASALNGSQMIEESDGSHVNSDVINGNSNNSSDNSGNGSSDSDNGIVTPPGENSGSILNAASRSLRSFGIDPNSESGGLPSSQMVANGTSAAGTSSAMEVDDDGSDYGDFVFLHELEPVKPPEKKPEELTKTFLGFDKISFCSHIPESHHYFKIPHAPVNSGEFLRAYQRDIKVLEEGLPDGIFIKGYEQRMDLFSAIILGPENTPYEGGIFVFDIKLPDRYPLVPPQFFFVSFTKHRMNPNLYAADGKVCVSLLGTWQGSSKCELWCKKSTLLQVLVSIQGLILVNEPYFNEPGHKNIPGDVRVTTAARFYNEQALVLLLQSLLGMLEKPPLPWQFEITFILKTEIPKLIQRVEGWIHKTPGIPPPDFNLFPIGQQIEITTFLSKLKGHHQKYCNI